MSCRADSLQSAWHDKVHGCVMQLFSRSLVLQEIFTTLGSVVEVKVIKDRVTGMSAGYGFVTFTDHRVADLALQCFNGRVLYGQEVRVNWAFQKDQREDTSAHFHTFVGDLSSEV